MCVWGGIKDVEDVYVCLSASDFLAESITMF